MESRTSRLAAILGESINKASNQAQLKHIDLELISCNSNQPRRHFDQDHLNELAQSIKQYGVLQPIILQEVEEEKYVIIAGERRWRASKIAGLTTIPAIIKCPNEERDCEVFALTENLQRQNLSPVEEALNYAKFISEYKYTQEELSQIVGKSRSHIANLLRINSLPDSIKGYLEEQKLSLGHAKLIAGRTDAEELAKIIIDKDLNIRQTEALLQVGNASTKQSSRKEKKTNPDLDAEIIEQNLSQKLGVKVQIDKSKGRIIIPFASLLELDKLLGKLDKLTLPSLSETY
jgi:ParB family transcriptional regulator, chromosome partitioning protein